MRQAVDVTCPCNEGFISLYGEDGKLEGYERTGVKAHDCDYIRWRNSKIPEAEEICRMMGLPIEGLGFLRIMDAICRNGNSAGTFPRLVK